VGQVDTVDQPGLAAASGADARRGRGLDERRARSWRTRDTAGRSPVPGSSIMTSSSGAHPKQPGRPDTFGDLALAALGAQEWMSIWGFDGRNRGATGCGPRRRRRTGTHAANGGGLDLEWAPDGAGHAFAATQGVSETCTSDLER